MLTLYNLRDSLHHSIAFQTKPPYFSNGFVICEWLIEIDRAGDDDSPFPYALEVSPLRRRSTCLLFLPDSASSSALVAPPPEPWDWTSTLALTPDLPRGCSSKVQYVVLDRKAGVRSGCTGGADLDLVGAGASSATVVKMQRIETVPVDDLTLRDIPLLFANHPHPLADGIQGDCLFPLFRIPYPAGRSGKDTGSSTVSTGKRKPSRRPSEFFKQSTAIRQGNCK
jgi:hypothetical protein